MPTSCAIRPTSSTRSPPAKPQKEMVDLAVQLIEQKTTPFEPEAFRDHYQDALKALVQEKMKGTQDRRRRGGRAAVRRQRHRPDGGAEAQRRQPEREHRHQDSAAFKRERASKAHLRMPMAKSSIEGPQVQAQGVIG